MERFRNGRLVADWLSELTGVRISRYRGWEYLRDMGYRAIVPLPQHQETSKLPPTAVEKK
ncbi:MAG: winged helix-turn-helix domain-containing protein [Moorea sp. SIO2I5]|nr:winged helix-turn-helix domain-containing protein [Moorena sp. SIO2I5]